MDETIWQRRHTGTNRSVFGEQAFEGVLVMMARPADPDLDAIRPRPFDSHPALVFWETTRACELACRHCRATAQPEPLPGELSTQQGKRLIDDVADFGRPRPVLVLTGGDLMMRPDLEELLVHAQSRGLTVAVSPSATSHLTEAWMTRFQQFGVHGLSVSVDATAERHDGIRGVPGTYARSMVALRQARTAGLHPQVNTVVMKSTVRDLADVAAMLVHEEVPVWEVFFLVATGRAFRDAYPDRAQVQDILRFLLEVTRYGITVRTVEAPFLRRMLVEEEEGTAAAPGALYAFLIDRFVRLVGSARTRDRIRLSRTGTLDGDGILFVAYDGTVYPGGLLPVRLGNVSQTRLVDLYRTAPLLHAIRARSFAGRCGACQYRDVCGGSRARAFADTGDPLGTDPLCPWLGTESEGQVS